MFVDPENEVQSMTVDMVDRLLSVQNEFEKRRARLSGAADQSMALWSDFAEQGILGAAFLEDVGGFGGSMRDISVLMSLVGKWLVVEPVLSTILAGQAFTQANADDKNVSISRIISGEASYGFGYLENDDPLSSLKTIARQTTDGYVLTGKKPLVRHSDVASGLFIGAMLDNEPALFVIEAEHADLIAQKTRLMDSSSGAQIVLSDTPAKLVLSGRAACERILVTALIGLSAEVCGICERLNDATFSYLMIRKQFGVSLAQFQALQHRASDLYIAAEKLKFYVDHVITLVDGEGPNVLSEAFRLKAMADDVGKTIGHDAVQLHGGMGVSDELDVSHFMRRLAVIRSEFGNSDTILFQSQNIKVKN